MLMLKMRQYFIDNFPIRNVKEVFKFKKKLNNINNNDIINLNDWKSAFKKYINIGSKTSFDVCSKFFEINLNAKKKCNILLNDFDPIVIFMVKNDLLRTKMIINYYRKLGIKLFAVIDDESTDGTYEYLLEQSDVDLYTTNLSYTTNIRQARINRLIDLYGFNKWYLIIDSDELFTYHNCENISIDKYISTLKTKTVKSLLLDMYSEEGLFSEVKDYEEITKKFKYFSLGYYYEKNIKGKFIIGGKRSKEFNNNCTASKISLVKFENGMIMSNSHCMFPYYYNFQDATTILRHYKFIKSDIKRIKERIKNNSFVDGSREYKNYLNRINNDNNINFFDENSYEWNNSNDLTFILKSLKGNKNEKK